MSPRTVLAAALGVALAAACAAGAQTPRRLPDNPGARAHWFMHGRQSAAQPPAARLQRARQQRQALQYAPRRSVVFAGARGQAVFSPTGSGAWTALGPAPLDTSGSTAGSGPGAPPGQDYGAISGRVTAIAIDPADPSGNTVYVGAAFGGIWKSTNALGASPTFTPLDDSAPTLSVGAIAVDGSTSPTTILVGTGEGNDSLDSYYGDGLLESTDGGVTWTQVTSADGGTHSFVGLSFSRLLFDPVNPNIVLAGVTSHDNDSSQPTTTGIFRSLDHGKTWSAVPTIAGSHSAMDIVYDATHQTYYAAIATEGIYQSTDQGLHWATTATPFANSLPATTKNGNSYDFERAALAARNGTIYALIGDSSSSLGSLSTPTPCTSANTPNCDTGLVQSSNGGVTWMPIPMPDTSTAPGGTFANIFCESIGGSAQLCQSMYDIDIAAPPGSTGLVVGGLDIWSTATTPPMPTNGSGVSGAWTDLTEAYGDALGEIHTDQHALAMLNANTWFVGNDGGAWATTTAGASWKDLNATLNTLQFYSVAPDQHTPGVWIGGSQDNGTAKLSGSGLSWTRWFWGDGGFTATNPSVASQYFTENYDIGVWRSDQSGTDTGNDLTDVVDNGIIADASGFYVPFIVRPPPNTASLMLGTCRVWAGPDDDTGSPVAGANGWFAYSNDLTTGGSGAGTCGDNGSYITAVAAAAGNPAIAWAVTDDGNVEKTTNFTAAAANAPATWTNMATATLPSQAAFSSVAINPLDPDTVYVGVQGFGTGHVFKTSDGGSSWTDISGNLPDAPVNWVLIDPLAPNHNLYVASDLGVFVATDGGVMNEQWMQTGQGLPDTAVLQLALSPASWPQRELVAATHGRGMWEIAPLAVPSFSLAASPAAQTVLANAPASFAVQVTGANGETGPITLSCTAPATGCTVAPTSVALNESATVTLAASAVTAGAQAITISGSDGVSTETTSATITGQNFQTSASPAIQSVLTGAGASLSLQVNAAAGYAGPIALACTTPASGCSVSPASLSGSGTATVTVAAGAIASGSNTITLTATGSGTTQTATAAVTVQSFAVSLAAPPAAVMAGAGASLDLTTSASNGFTSTLTLACTAPATGCTVSPASVAAGSPATVSVSASALTDGANTITVTATTTTGNVTQTSSATVTVEDFGLALTAPGTPVMAGSAATLTLTTNAIGGYSGALTLACTAPASGCTFNPASVAAGNPATLTIAASALTGGSNNITVTASGSGLTRSASATATVADFSLTAASSSASVTPGQTASYALTLTAQGGFSNAVSLTCSGAPATTVCSIKPDSLTPSASGSPVTVTVTTTAAGAAPPPLSGPAGDRRPWLLALLALAALAATLAVNGSRRRPAGMAWRGVRAVLTAVLLGATLLAASCGGSGAAPVQTNPPVSNPGTPQGTYALVVTATSGSDTHTLPLTLTVQ